MIRRIEKGVDLNDRHSLFRFSHLLDFVGGAYVPFLHDTEVEPGPSAGCQQGRHPRLVHPNADAITGDARLSDFKQRNANPITIADANGIVEQSFDREVFAELSVDEVAPLQLVLPIRIGFALVGEDGALLTSVPDQVALTISV